MKKKQIKTYDKKNKNITIASVDREEVHRLKENMYKITDTITIIGLERFTEYTRLNPISISVTNNDLIRYLALSRKYKYRFIPKRFLLSAAFTNDTQVIHLISNGISDAKISVINRKFVQLLGQINLFDVESSVKHLPLPFITQTLTDILNFDVNFLDDSGKLIEFKKDETKVPSFSFMIQVIK